LKLSNITLRPYDALKKYHKILKREHGREICYASLPTLNQD
jgi:hypothetical protein